MMFDRICRKNGIRHRLTEPASPNQNGKVERFHGTLRPDFFDLTGPFPSIEAAQAAVDAWVADYNDERPHQALDPHWPVTPAERFAPIPASSVSCCRCGCHPPSQQPPSISATLSITPRLLIMVVRLVLRSRRSRPWSSAGWLNGRVVRSSSTWWCRRRGT